MGRTALEKRRHQNSRVSAFSNFAGRHILARRFANVQPFKKNKAGKTNTPGVPTLASANRLVDGVVEEVTFEHREVTGRTRKHPAEGTEAFINVEAPETLPGTAPPGADGAVLIAGIEKEAVDEEAVDGSARPEDPHPQCSTATISLIPTSRDAVYPDPAKKVPRSFGAQVVTADADQSDVQPEPNAAVLAELLSAGNTESVDITRGDGQLTAGPNSSVESGVVTVPGQGDAVVPERGRDLGPPLNLPCHPVTQATDFTGKGDATEAFSTWRTTKILVRTLRLTR